MSRKSNQDNSEWKSIKVGTRSVNIECVQTTDYKAQATVQEEIQYSSAFCIGMNKAQCGFCKMWFEKKSVSNKVSNQRILDLQKKWNIDRSAKRFQLASFLYNICTVCIFCAQLFDTEDPAVENTNNISDEAIQANERSEPVLIVDIVRKNLAIDRRAYQSSDVDGLTANNCINSSSKSGSKTRFEVDPWWEMDLGSLRNVHAVAVTIMKKLQSETSLYIIALSKSVGFENPSLDRVLSEAIGYQNLKFSKFSSGEAEIEEKSWELPADSRVRAVRIQLRGQGCLHLMAVKAFQGDAPDIEAPHTDDDKISYAAIPLSIIRKFAKKKKISKPIASVKVHSVSDKIRDQYTTMFAWRSRAMEAVGYFDGIGGGNGIDWLLTLRDLLFHAVIGIDEKIANSAAALQMKPLPIRTHEMRNNALMLPEPRCALRPLLLKLRTIFLSMQSRQRLKEIGALQKFPPLIAIATTGFDQALGCLASVFHYLETGTFIAASSAVTVFTATQKIEAGRASPKSTNSATDCPDLLMTSCSWSQFLIIMELFCRYDYNRIVDEAFAVDATIFESLSESYSPPVIKPIAPYNSSIISPGNSSCITDLDTFIPPTPFNRHITLNTTTDKKKKSLKVLSKGRPTVMVLSDNDNDDDSVTSGMKSKISHMSAIQKLYSKKSQLSKQLNESEEQHRSINHRHIEDSSLLSPVTVYTKASPAYLPSSTGRDDRDGLSWASIEEGFDDSVSCLTAFHKMAGGGSRLGSRTGKKSAPLTLLELTNRDRGVLKSSGKGISLERIPLSRSIERLAIISNRLYADTDTGLDTESTGDDNDMCLNDTNSFEGTTSSRVSHSRSLPVPPQSSAESVLTVNTTLDFGGTVGSATVFSRSSSSRKITRQSSKRSDSFVSRAGLTVDVRSSSPTHAGNTASPSTMSSKMTRTMSMKASPTRSEKSVATSTLPQPSVPNFTEETSEVIKVLTQNDFLKPCALCLRKFPISALGLTVILKHVQYLRKELERGPPATYNKTFSGANISIAKKTKQSMSNEVTATAIASSDIDTLAGGLSQVTVTVTVTRDEVMESEDESEKGQGMKLYRTVRVCQFCSQFFDPDVEDGVALPSRQALDEVTTSTSKDLTNQILRFYDDRYGDKYSNITWSLKNDQGAVDARMRAKKALEVFRQGTANSSNANPKDSSPTRGRG